MSSKDRALYALKLILRPLIHLLLRNGVSFGDFLSISRSLFVEVADQEPEFALSNEKQTASRIAVTTGINRRDVKRLLDTEETDPKEGDRAYANRAVRVINGWTTDKRFLNSKGKPRVLIYSDSKTGGFEQLVQSHAGDLSAKTILEELVRVGSVQKNTRSDSYKLIKESYIPFDSNEEMLRIGSSAIYDLLNTVNHNTGTKNNDESRLQTSIFMDNISEENTKIYRDKLEKAAKVFRSKQKKILNDLDRDRTSKLQGTGTGRYRVGFGIYHIEEKYRVKELK